MSGGLPSRHRLLERQLAKARRANASAELDLNLLLELVSQAYTEQEISLRLNDRATALMSDELTELNDRLRSEAEARARNSEAYLQTVLQNAAEAVISINREGEITAFNRTAEKMFGYAVDEILGLSVGKLFNEWTAETEQHLREFIESDAESFVPSITAARGRRKSGEAFPAEISLLR
jgi:PAS domain S-box-containing protein